MSLLRPLCGGRLLSSKLLARQYIGGTQARWASSSSSDKTLDSSLEPAPKVESSDSPAAVPGDSSMIRQEDSAEGMVEHRLDFRAPTDHGTSQFSPIPKRVMDGSEPGNLVAAAVISGAPVEMQARTVRIYRPAKTATQSGNWHAHHWRMDWDVLGKGYRWENPLMGWQSSADPVQGTHLNFKSREDAIRFAQKQGYEYFVQEPNERRRLPKAYANNFLYSPKKLKTIRSK